MRITPTSRSCRGFPDRRRPRLAAAPRTVAFLLALTFAAVPFAQADPLERGDAATLRAAIQDLMRTFPDRYPRGANYLARLAALEKAPDAAALAALRREALTANPLVSGQPILYVSRAQYVPDHHNTETMFQTGELNTGSFRGGGAIKTVDFGRGAAVRTLAVSTNGLFRDPDVSFDGKRILFAFRRSIQEDYHIWTLAADGSAMKPLTSAAGVFDIDPIWLPDGGILFTSSREPKYCGCNRHIMGNLCRMEADGANIVQIGKNTLQDGHPCLLPDGRIIYDRWEYVDRNFGDAQGLWTVNPDGTAHALYWGNNTGSPGAVLDAHPVPGTEQVICTFSSCHDRPWGAIAIIDRRLGLDGPPAVIRTWPPDAERLVNVNGSFDAFTGVRPKYEDPYPLSDRYFLCARMTGNGEEMGIVLLDTFGNELLLHAEAPGCFDPMPLAPRAAPPIVPARRNYENREALVYVTDVYRGTHMQGVAPGTVKYLRVVESPEKRHWTNTAWGGQGVECPAMNWHDFGSKRILGTVPVEADGSAYVKVPSDRFVYFQVLDADGMMIQSMRSGAIFQSGESAGCVGCHEERRSTPETVGGFPLALRRPPDRLEGWHGAPRFFNYLAEVQPVLDRHCMACHDFGKPGAAKVILAGDRDLVFNASYNELWRRGLIRVVGAGPVTTQPAYSWGAHASRVVQVLRAGHHNAKLSPEEWDRLATWIDLNAPYYPSFATAYPGGLGGRAPLQGGELGRLGALIGLDLGRTDGCGSNPGPLVSFDRPELSPCLARLADANDPRRAEAQAIIRTGAERLRQVSNPDGDRFVMCAVDRQREDKYERRLAIERRNRGAVRTGQRVYDEDSR